MKKYIFIAITAIIGLTACGSDNEEDTEDDCRTINFTASQKQIASIYDKFAFRLFGLVNEMEKDSDNIIISPLNASMAMTLMANGARDNTLSELLNSMGIDGYILDDLNSFHGKVSGDIDWLDTSNDIRIDNNLWLNDDINPMRVFCETATLYDLDVYQCGLELFRTYMDTECRHMLRHEINNILGDTDDDATMVIVNAFRFSGGWTSRFDESLTRKDIFCNSNGTQGEAEYMCKTASIIYGNEETFAWISLPFGCGAYYFNVVLPNNGYTIEQCIDAMKESAWAQLGDNIETGTHLIALKLPKFSLLKVDELSKELQEMGIHDAFTSQANFRYLSNTAATLAQVKQVNMLTIDEKGDSDTTDKASGNGEETNSATNTGMVIDFNVNRPFIFMLTEKSTGMILAIGRISDMGAE